MMSINDGRPMHVVHAYKIYRPDADGGIPQVIHMLTGTENKRIESEIVVARYRGRARAYDLDGVPVTAVASIGTALSTPLAPLYLFVLRKLARNADILVHHAPFPLTDIGVFLGLKKTTALVVYWHAEVVGRTLLLSILAPIIRSALRRADRIIVSDQAMLASSAFLKPHLSKCVVVPYGLDVDYWNTLDAAGCTRVAELRLQYPRLILAVGRLVGYKGFDILLNALKSVDAQLVIIGEGPLFQDLKTLAARNGMEHRVVLKGRVTSDEIKCHIHASRLFVLPSVTEAEAFGLVQVEAMAAGRPVINTQLSTAVPHVARNGLEGITVPPNDSLALGSAISTLLSDPGLAERLGRAGRDRARSEFGCDTYRARIEEAFEGALHERRAVSASSV